MRATTIKNNQLYEQKQFYKSLWIRVIIHILFWSIVFFFIVTMNQWFYRNNGFERLITQITVANFLVVLITYYWLSTWVLTALYQKKWLTLLIHLIAIHIFSNFSNYFVYTEVGRQPDVPQTISRIAAVYEQIGFINGLWSKTIFIFNWSFSYNIILTIVSVKFMKDVLVSQTQSARLERDNLNLELNFLRSQINPHFFFNAINSAYSLIVDKDDEAAAILVKLSSLMRYTLYKTGSPYVTLQQEVDFINDYVDLERIRHGRNVSILLRTEGQVSGLQIPPLLLLTFVENAFKHGINTTIRDSWVTVDLNVEDNQLRFVVRNSKPEEQRPTPNKLLQTSSGIGLANTQRRLQLLYPDAHQLHIEETKTTYTVNLTLLLDETTVNVPHHRRRAVGQRPA